MREGTVHFLEGTAYKIHTPIPGARGVIFSSFGGAAASKAGISHEKVLRLQENIFVFVHL